MQTKSDAKPPETKPAKGPQRPASNTTRVQDDFLAKLVDRQALFSMRLLDGHVMRGTLKTFDQYSLLLLPSPPGPLELIYKHAIASMAFEPTTESGGD